MLLDCHSHLHDLDFFTPSQQEEFLINARQNGVEQIICIGTDPVDSMNARTFAESHKNVFWTYGVHPEEVDKMSGGLEIPEVLSGATRSSRASISCATPAMSGGRDNGGRKELLEFRTDRLVAIGEVGLDYHSENYDRDAQIHLFNEMLQLATDLDLPLSLHVRNAFDDFFAVIHNFPSVRGVVHSFTDSKKTLRRILETTDFYVGVNGLATYSTLPTPPLERTILETDAPFLTPLPFRGIINQPAYIRNIADWLSKKLGVPLTEVEKITTENGKRLFNLPDPNRLSKYSQKGL